MPKGEFSPKIWGVAYTRGRLTRASTVAFTRASTVSVLQHSVDCGGGTGIFLLVLSSFIVLVRGPRASVWGSVYLDDHGEEDRDLK